ncbi:SDR family NAD(P)-dependent oxidoreductase [Croceicoccus mobilis]|uniref:Short-chain dehydrogenase/reductase n=1 Tax=Croceicoccus mobilis TaxID=1703339 RepID=A0A917DYM1_9SPHN|nr:SDR family NAD(P)-dependent oxidoreductase [Croceicoccus mobilis]GGD79995.1 putative short-chain dehydrogenase/reductase [Croceicoccus mobilis]
MADELRFDGQAAIVTGAAKGIGRAIALLLAKRGAMVVVNGNVRPEGHGPEEDVVAEIRAAGGSAVGVNGSVADDNACRAMAAAALDHFGRLDIIVNNAGTTDTQLRIQDAPSPVIDDQFAIHVKGPQQLFRAAWPHLQQSGQGRVINLGSASSLGIRSMHGWGGSYAICKSALYGLTRQMAGAGAEHGIKANLIMPYAYSTMVEKSFGGTEFGNWMQANFDPAMVAVAALYLMHRDCPVSGQFFSVGGGRMARVVFASRDGIHDPDLSPETVRTRWAEIMGEEDAEQMLGDGFFELPSQARDGAAFGKVLGGGK